MNPDACSYTIKLESVPIALVFDGDPRDSFSIALGFRFYHRPPRGWRRHVRRLKAAGQPVPVLGPRRWSQRAAKRHRQHVERRVRTDAAKALRGMIDRAMCFGLEAR